VEPGLPIVCIGLNYANHAQEANVGFLLRKGGLRK
jgi:2-keto-4-pentenoate hydratase/2-oxohepta-3-ene-1,7-dioic acid hydratase in catechol pathway